MYMPILIYTLLHSELIKKTINEFIKQKFKATIASELVTLEAWNVAKK